MVISPTAEPTAGGEPSPKSWWLYLLLGIALLIGGAIVLGDVVFASVISAIFIAWALVIVGVFQVVHAFSAVGWKGFVLDLLLGALYIAAGYSFWRTPWQRRSSSRFCSALSGLFRAVPDRARRRALAGGGLVSPHLGHHRRTGGRHHPLRMATSGLWVLGLCLGVDLIFHGFAWIGYSLSIPSKRSPQAA